MTVPMPLNDWGFPIYDHVISVPRDADYSRIDPRYHVLLKRFRRDMTPGQRLRWIDEGMALRHRVRLENEARARTIAEHRSRLLKMTVQERREWIDRAMEARHGSSQPLYPPASG